MLSTAAPSVSCLSLGGRRPSNAWQPSKRFASLTVKSEENPMDPKTLRYAPTHEWANLEGGVCTVGISKFAVDQLTDVVYIELPEVGDHVFAGESFGEIESVKAVSDLYSPINGEVTEVNEKLLNDPGTIAEDPYGKGWLVKIKIEPGATLDHLLSVEQYEKQIASEEH
jgi:glycine cleavage system H protein